MATLVQGLVARMGFDNTAYKKGMGEVQSIAHRTGNVIGGIGRTMRNVFAGYGAFRLVKGAISTASQFQRGMAEVSTALDTSKVSMPGLTKEVLELAKSVGVSPRGLTKAYNLAVQSGIKAGEATEFVRTAVKSSIAGLTDATVAVNVLTSMIAAYGDSAQNAVKYSDVLFEAIRLGKTTFPELERSIGRVAPIAAQMKVPFEEVAAAIATMTLKGISTDEAVTALRATLSSILNPTKQASETAMQLGVQFNAAAVASKGLSTFMREVMVATKGSPELLSRLYENVRGLIGVISTFTGTTFTEQLAAMRSAAGATETAFGKMNETIGRKWEEAKAKFEVAAIDLANRGLPWLTKKAQEASDAIDALSKAPIREEPATEAYGRARKEYQYGLVRFAPMAELIAGAKERGFAGKRSVENMLRLSQMAGETGRRHLEALAGLVSTGTEMLYRRTQGAAPYAEMRRLAGTPEAMAGRAAAAREARGAPYAAAWQHHAEMGRLPALGPKYPWAKTFGQSDWATGTMGKGITPPQEWAARAGQQTVDTAESVDTQIGKTFGLLGQVLYRITKRLEGIEDDLRTQNAR